MRDTVVPFLDLKSQYQAIKPEVDAAVIGVLESGQFVLGPAVQAFEQSFAKAYGIEHAIGCSSGTAALHLALLAAGIGRDDEVIRIGIARQRHRPPMHAPVLLGLEDAG